MEFGGVSRQTCLDLVPEASVGDYVLVHVGFAISRVDQEEAERSYELLGVYGAAPRRDGTRRRGFIVQSLMESDNTCRTCSAIPGKIVEVAASDHSALVDVAGVTRQVDLMLVQGENPAPGDWILIHVGFALTKITEDDALGHLHMIGMLHQEPNLEREAT